MESTGTTSWLGWPTQRQTTICLRFTAGTPESRTSGVACWSTRNDPLTSGSRRPPVSPSLFYPDPDTTTPLCHYVSNKPRFFPLLWWRRAATSSTNKPTWYHLLILRYPRSPKKKNKNCELSPSSISGHIIAVLNVTEEILDKSSI